jgi:hypothetical protein
MKNMTETIHHGDAETRRHGDTETRRQRDKGTRGRGDVFFVSVSACHQVTFLCGFGYTGRADCH